MQLFQKKSISESGLPGRNRINLQRLCLLLLVPFFLFSVTITVTDPSDAGVGTLRDAIGTAGNNDTIDFAPLITQVNLSTEITKGGVTGVSILGPMAKVDILQTGNGQRHFVFNTNSEFTVENVQIQKFGAASNAGGVVVDTATFTANSVHFLDIARTSLGGAFFCTNTASLTLTDSMIDNCSTTNRGGAIYCRINSTVTCTDSMITSCTSGNRGGSFFCDQSSTVTLTGSTIMDSTATNRGGAFFADRTSKIYITNSTIDNCSSSVSGGAFFCDRSALVDVTNSTISNCSATVNGGGIYCEDGSMALLSDSTITNCEADNFGGGIFSSTNGVITLENATITDCTSVLGGAIYLDSTSELTIDHAISLINNNANLGKDIYVEGGGKLYFNLVLDSEIPYPIEGDGGPLGEFKKTGLAKLTLNGNNTYSAPTEVQSGELMINGSVMSDVTVESLGVLSGNCVIKAGNDGDGNLTNKGTVSPGNNGIGSLTIEGEYTQEAGANLRIDITPNGQKDQLFLSANGANIQGGDLTVVLENGTYIKGTTYTIIQGTVTGPGFDLPLVKMGPQADKVQISLQNGNTTLLVENTLLFPSQVVNPGNPQKVVDVFADEEIDPNSTLAKLLEAMGQLSNQELNQTLNHMSPAPFGAYEWINLTNNSMLARLLALHINDLPCSKRDCRKKSLRFNAWIDGFGNFMKEKQYKCLRSFDSNNGGILLGVDRCFDPCIVGAGAGYLHGNMLWDDHGGKSTINSYFVSLFGSLQGGYGSIDGSIIGGLNQYNTTRRIYVSMVDLQATSTANAGFFTAHLGGKFSGMVKEITLTYFGSIDYHYLNVARFRESDGGVGIALDVRNRISNMLQTTIGGLISTVKQLGSNCVRPFAGLSWVRKIPLNLGRQRGNFVGQHELITAYSFSGFKNFLSPEVGVKITTPNGPSFSIGYKGEFNGQAKIHQADTRFEMIF